METLPIGCVGVCQTFQQLLFSVFHCEGVVGMPQQDKQLAVHLMQLKMLLRMNIEGQACFFGDVPVRQMRKFVQFHVMFTVNQKEPSAVDVLIQALHMKRWCLMMPAHMCPHHAKNALYLLKVPTLSGRMLGIWKYVYPGVVLPSMITGPSWVIATSQPI